MLAHLKKKALLAKYGFPKWSDSELLQDCHLRVFSNCLQKSLFEGVLQMYLPLSLAQAPVKHILYSSTRDTQSIDPANTKYARSTLSPSETPGRKFTIFTLHVTEICGKNLICWELVNQTFNETIRQSNQTTVLLTYLMSRY